MKTLFEAGEEVILCSKNRPELNGDAVVIFVANKGIANFKCPHCDEDLSGKRVLRTAYYLDVESNHEVFNCCAPWNEEAIKKKHKGSDFSFNEMLNEIKSIEKISA